MLTVILDGYNVFHALRLIRGKDLSLVEQFLQRLERAAALRGWQVKAVLEGPSYFLPRESGPLTIEYAPRGKTADTVIERMVYQASDRAQVVVITQDRAEADLVLGLGAHVWSAERLSEELAAA